MPHYPEEARRARFEGRVLLQAVLDEEGKVAELNVLRSFPKGHGFEEAAVAAVRKWRYEPATRSGEPVAVYFTIRVDFNLD